MRVRSRFFAGGADMLTKVGDPADPVIICVSKIRGAELNPSYEQEKTALRLVLDCARANCPAVKSARWNCIGLGLNFILIRLLKSALWTRIGTVQFHIKQYISPGECLHDGVLAWKPMQ